MKIVFIACCSCLLIAVVAPESAAQSRESHWGISAAIVSRWDFPDVLADVWNLETDMRGAELRAGVVRGSDGGGDWGISFVKKTVENGSTVQLRENACVEVLAGTPRCARGSRP